MSNVTYAGFWVRTKAAVIDRLLIILLTLPLLTLIYGQVYWTGDSLVSGFWDLMLSYILPAIAVILFWIYKSATPGKMVFKLSIVDAKTGQKASNRQLIGRYLAYCISIIPLGLGLIWVGIDQRKQGWHDKLAGTLVIRNTQDTEITP